MKVWWQCNQTMFSHVFWMAIWIRSRWWTGAWNIYCTMHTICAELQHNYSLCLSVHWAISCACLPGQVAGWFIGNDGGAHQGFKCCKIKNKFALPKDSLVYSHPSGLLYNLLLHGWCALALFLHTYIMAAVHLTQFIQAMCLPFICWV